MMWKLIEVYEFHGSNVGCTYPHNIPKVAEQYQGTGIFYETAPYANENHFLSPGLFLRSPIPV